MSWYAVPVIIALLLKCALLVIARRAGTKSEYLFGFIVAFAFLNVSELALFMRFSEGANAAIWILKSYYICAFLVLAYGCQYAAETGRLNSKLNRQINIVVWVYAAVAIAMVLFTKSIIAGATPISYALTAERGSFYWIFQVGVILAVARMGWSLAQGYRKAANHRIECQCAYALIALTPFLLSAIGIIIIMQMGININAMAILPIASTVFLWIITLSENEHRLTDIRRFFPFSYERIMARKIQAVLGGYAQEEHSHKEALAEIEKMLVTYKHRKMDGNVLQIAKSMDLPRSTLYSILQRHKIPTKQEESSS